MSDDSVRERERQSNSKLYVCPDCFADEDLRSAVEFMAEVNVCSFCGAQSDDPIAAPLDEVAAHIKSFLEIEYDDPANWLSYEGGYIGSVYSTYELIAWELPLDLPRDDGRLMEALANSIDHQGSPEGWCERNPFSLSEPEQMHLSWDHFCNFVKHKRRYFFHLVDRGAADDPFEEILSPDALLSKIAKRIEDLRLVTELAFGTRIYRVRYQPAGVSFTKALDLGPPPSDRAKQNRMSPAGIPMFYGSEDASTAIAETRDEPGDYAVGEFRLLRTAQVLNLFEIPPVPGFFSESRGWKREPLVFLHRFAHDIAQPIERDDRVHIEYVPTQIVTEYFRIQFRFANRPLDGICYDSSRNPGHRSYVLFAERKDLSLGEETLRKLGQPTREHQAAAWLELVGITVQRES